ncbi:hypothetical protein [Phytohalomonas tamaricis]|nr:hypothetical protein [Phytohalomonas tamaricis]
MTFLAYVLILSGLSSAAFLFTLVAMKLGLHRDDLIIKDKGVAQDIAS